jgi:putative transposase
VKILEEVRRRCDVSVVGYVVMPEHVHLILSEPINGTLSKLLQVLKQRVSRALRGGTSSEQLTMAVPAGLAGPRRFWHRRYYDFNVYSAEKLREKLDYVHANPVKRGLVTHPKDWPWSSWSFYATSEQGVVKIDPTGEEAWREELRGEESPPFAKGAKGRAPSSVGPR